MEWEPAVRVVLMYVATPERFSKAIPRVVCPSLKMTLPVGMEVLTPDTVAVNMTGVANEMLGSLVLKVVVLEAKLTTWRNE